MAWLYGASILAIQSGFESAAAGASILEGLSFTAGGICLILLLAAMSNRGSSQDWEPPLSLQLMAGGLIIAILFAGYKVHTTGVKSNPVDQPIVAPAKQPAQAPATKNGGQEP